MVNASTTSSDDLLPTTVLNLIHVKFYGVFHIALIGSFVCSHDVPTGVDLARMCLLGRWRSERVDRHAILLVDSHDISAMNNVRGSYDAVSGTTTDAIILAL